MVKWKFFRGKRWFIPVALIGIIVVASLVIISVYSPSENKMSEITDEICTDSTKTEACKEALLLSEIWGVKRWTKTFRSPNYYDRANFVQQTSDGGYVIVGNEPNNRPQLFYLIKTDENGNI